MRRSISLINLVICAACVLMLMLDRLLPDMMLFNEKPAKIVALVACVSTFVTAVVQVGYNRKKARRREAVRRRKKSAK